MEATRFDALARALTRLSQRRPSRRDVLHVLGGGVLAGLLAPLAGEESAAKKAKGCPGGTRRCGKKCISNKHCCKDSDCSRRHNEFCYRSGRCDCLPRAKRDRHGVCGFKPDCSPVLTICTANDQCCSRRCNVPSDDGMTLRCNRGNVDCLTDFDCAPGRVCRGWDCVRR